MKREVLRRLERLLGPDGLREAGVVIGSDGEVLDMPAWLEALTSASDELPLPDVPPVVRQDLRRLFEITQPVEPETAVLVRDTRKQERLVGVRGVEAGDGWSLMFTSAVADVVLDVRPIDGGTLDVAGHVMAHRQLGRAYRVRAEGPAERTVDGDTLGRFRLSALPPGRYELSIGDGEVGLTLAADLGEETA